MERCPNCRSTFDECNKSGCGQRRRPGWRAESEDGYPCKQRTPAGEPIGSACPDCGHTNIVHPGPHNPTLSACVICELPEPRDSFMDGAFR